MKYKDFKDKYEKGMDNLSSSFTDFPWEDSSAYGNWCAQTYYYVCHSTRILALSAAQAPLEKNDQHMRSLNHVSEESGHEHLALKDLKTLGFQLKDYPEMPETSGFYQSQYYFIQHHGAGALFGWIAMLEGAAVRWGGDCYKRVCKSHGSKAGNFWRVHSEEDVGHLEQAFAQIERIGPKELEAAYKNFNFSACMYAEILKKSMQLSSERELDKVAS